MELKALVNSTNDMVAWSFFARTPSRIRRIVRICDVVDLFLRKPFWFFLMLSILGSLRLVNMAFYISAAMNVSVIPQYFLANPRPPFLGKGKMHPFIHLSIRFWLYMALQCRSSMSSNCLVFHTSWGILSTPAAFLFLIFLSTESSSFWVNGPSFMSNCLLIILVIGSCVTFGGFPSKFSKCCFHRCIHSCWLVAFSSALAVLFLLLTSFIVWHAILNCLSSTESLILSIWFCMYSVCSFRYDC